MRVPLGGRRVRVYLGGAAGGPTNTCPLNIDLLAQHLQFWHCHRGQCRSLRRGLPSGGGCGDWADEEGVDLVVGETFNIPPDSHRLPIVHRHQQVLVLPVIGPFEHHATVASRSVAALLGVCITPQLHPLADWEPELKESVALILPARRLLGLHLDHRAVIHIGHHSGATSEPFPDQSMSTSF